MKKKIITLKNNELSERIAKESIEQAALMNISVDYFEAINGFHAEQHLVDLGIRPKKKMRTGALGCALSHIYLWKQCVEDNEPYLILEHDGYFIEPLPNNVLDLFEDVLKLDNSNPYSEFYEQDIENKSKNQLQILDIEEHAKLLGEVGYYSRGAYAYIIKPHAAKKILEWIFANGIIKADHQLGKDICKISTVNKSIVRLHPYYLGRVKMLSTTNFLQ
jgi:GR25 family glycosyltransferase involved in LPS biosynthesis